MKKPLSKTFSKELRSRADTGLTNTFETTIYYFFNSQLQRFINANLPVLLFILYNERNMLPCQKTKQKKIKRDIRNGGISHVLALQVKFGTQNSRSFPGFFNNIKHISRNIIFLGLFFWH